MALTIINTSTYTDGISPNCNMTRHNGLHDDWSFFERGGRIPVDCDAVGSFGSVHQQMERRSPQSVCQKLEAGIGSVVWVWDDGRKWKGVNEPLFEVSVNAHFYIVLQFAPIINVSRSATEPIEGICIAAWSWS